MINSRIIETLELFDKKLLIDIKVAEVEYQFYNQNYKTTKWIRFEDWQQIYTKIEKSLSSKSNLKEFKDQKFRVANDIDVQIKKLPLHQCYLDLLLLSEFQVLPQILQIHINRVNVGELRRKIRQFQKLSSKTLPPVEVRKDLFPEYDPVKASGGGTNNAPAYKPSVKVENSTSGKECIQDNERYSPKPINSSIEKISDDSSENEYKPNKEDQSPIVPTYTPSQITKDLTHSKKIKEEYQPENLDPEKAKIDSKKIKKTHRTLQTDQQRSHISKEAPYENRHQLKKRRKSNDIKDELFGSDDSDNNNLPVPHIQEMQTTRLKPLAMKMGKQSSDISSQESKSRNLEDKRADKIRLKADCKTDDTSDKRKYPEKRKRKRGTIDSWLNSDDWIQKGRATTNTKPKKEQENPMDSTAGSEEESRKPLFKVEKMKNLKHLSTEDLLSTFEEFKPLLDQYFQKFSKQKTHVVNNIDETILSMMSTIEESKMINMIEKLREFYQDQTTKECTELFINIMLPEWLLAISMKEHKMSRTDVLTSLNEPIVSIL